MDKAKLIQYLRSSLVLQNPNIVTDPAYKYTDLELEDVLTMVLPAHNPSYTELTFPKNEEYFLILLAKKEIYYRLATATAPLYPLTAEGAELRKDVRFEHYMSLIRRVEVEYTQSLSHFESNKEVEVKDVFLDRKHLSLYNYENAINPTVEFTADTIRSASVDISWSKFDVVRGKFAEYKVYVSLVPIYDEYLDAISPDAKLVSRITDIHRTKFRISGLTPNTHYYIGVASEDINKLKGFYEEEITTLSDAPAPTL